MQECGYQLCLHLCYDVCMPLMNVKTTAMTHTAWRHLHHYLCYDMPMTNVETQAYERSKKLGTRMCILITLCGSCTIRTRCCSKLVFHRDIKNR